MQLRSEETSRQSYSGKFAHLAGFVRFQAKKYADRVSAYLPVQTFEGFPAEAT